VRTGVVLGVTAMAIGACSSNGEPSQIRSPTRVVSPSPSPPDLELIDLRVMADEAAGQIAAVLATHPQQRHWGTSPIEIDGYDRGSEPILEDVAETSACQARGWAWANQGEFTYYLPDTGEPVHVSAAASARVSADAGANLLSQLASPAEVVGDYGPPTAIGHFSDYRVREGVRLFAGFPVTQTEAGRARAKSVSAVVALYCDWWSGFEE
jgi:hypothetical protein